jgi:tRNA-specific 2-thiouridylase
MDRETATVTLGDPASLEVERLWLDELTLRDGVQLPIAAEAVIRYRGTRAQAKVSRQGEGVLVEFSQTVTAPSPGQFAVFYDGERVLGGGLIRESAPG